MILNNSVQSSM